MASVATLQIHSILVQQYRTGLPKDIFVVTAGKKNLWEFIHLCCVIFMLEEKLKVLVEENSHTFLLFYCFLSGMSSYLKCIKYEKPFREFPFKMLTINRWNHGFLCYFIVI